MSRLPAEKRREQLLDVATDLFAKSGYARATTAELAKTAGVTEPIIYRHFESKKALFIALIQRTARDTLDHWKQRLKDASDPTERLRRLIGENPMVQPEARKAYRVLIQAVTETDDQEIQRAVSTHFLNLHTFLLKELRDAQDERKVLRIFTPELLAWLLIDVGLGYGLLEAFNVPGHGADTEGMDVQLAVERLFVGRSSED